MIFGWRRLTVKHRIDIAAALRYQIDACVDRAITGATVDERFGWECEAYRYADAYRAATGRATRLPNPATLALLRTQERAAGNGKGQ
jgi:hypothetical protein